MTNPDDFLLPEGSIFQRMPPADCGNTDGKLLRRLNVVGVDEAA
jgi:hypothetical protein